MRVNKATKMGAVLAAMATTVIILFGCSEKIVDNSSPNAATVKMAVKWAASGSATGVTEFRVTITADDLEEPLVFPMILFNGYLEGLAIVPVGTDRLFTVEALNSAGIVLYRGEATIDIGFASLNELNIDMFPVAPMVYITPHYQNVLVGDKFAIDIVVNDIPRLSSITAVLYITLAIPDQIPYLPFHPDSLAKGPDLDTADNVWWESYIQDTIDIGAWSRDTLDGLVDAFGDARIATVTFGSHGDWEGESVFTFMQLSINSLLSTERDDLGYEIPIPINEVYTDGAMVIIRKVPNLSPEGGGRE